MKCPIWLIALSLLLSFGGCTKKRDLAHLQYLQPFASVSDDSLFVVFSSSIEGYVQSCGCTSAPLGDIARFAQVYKDIQAISKKPVLFIDAGNLLFDSPSRNAADLCQDNARIKLLLGVFKDLGLSQTIVGPMDDARGSAYRENWYKQMGLEAFVKPTSDRLITINNNKVGLIGIKESASKDAVQKVVAQLKKNKADLIVALSQRPKAEALTFFENFAGIDVVIQGQTEDFSAARPQRLGINGPLFLQGGRQEHYFPIFIAQNLKKRGENPLVVDDRAYIHSAETELIKSRIKSLKAQAEDAEKTRAQFLHQRIAIAEQDLRSLEEKNQKMKPLAEASLLFQAIPLSKNVDPLPAVKNAILAYEKNIPALVAECEKNLECPKSLPNEPVYVGAQACKACHQQAYDVWQKAVYFSEGQDEAGQSIKRQMGHSKAWLTLVEVNKDKDRSCIGCHSIGFMQPGGYCKASDVDFRKDVQCESCHGPGSLHAQSGDKRQIAKPTEKTCRGCHHVPHIEKYENFNFEQRLHKILGPGHGERLLKELQHKAKKTQH